MKQIKTTFFLVITLSFLHVTMACAFDLSSIGSVQTGSSGNTTFPEGKFITAPDRSSMEMAKRIQGEPDFEKIRNLSKRDADLDIARRVGFFYIGGGSCSGFLVGPDLFLSNHHCVYDDETSQMRSVSRFEIFMDYLDDNDRGHIRSKVKEIVKADEELDFALLRLEIPLGTRLGWFQLGSGSEGKSGAVKIFQHPRGRSKEVSRKNSSVVKNTGTVLHYLADTEGGSSGSPVFSRNGDRVIALHHVGTRKYNEGVLLDAIVPKIKQWLWPLNSTQGSYTAPAPDSSPSSTRPQTATPDDQVMQTIQDLLNSN